VIISYTGKNRDQDLVIPIEQSTQVIGSITIPARSFPNKWTLELTPAEDADQKLSKGSKGKCGNKGKEKQEQASPAFDLIARDPQGRERDVSNLRKPISLSMFALKPQKDDKVCFGFSKTEDSKFRCLDQSSTKSTNTKNPDVIYVESKTDHLTTFAVLFSTPNNGDNDLRCDTLWIISVSLIGSAFAFVGLVIVVYMNSIRFRAMVMGFHPKMTIDATLHKIERLQ